MTAHRVGAAALRGLEARLSERDWQIVRSVGEHRFLTTGQLQRLHFAGHASALAGIRACVRVLDRLRSLRLLTRLARTVGGLHAGSRAYVWCLDVVGDRLLKRDLDAENGSTSRRRFYEPSTIFLAHMLAVAEARVELEEAARSGVFELEQVEVEPAAWRRYVDAYGRPAVLKPDLATTTVAGDFEDRWLIEVDRGTESLRTLLAKCGQYEAYRRTGREQAAHEVFPLVVWIVPDKRRRDRLEQEIRSTRGLEPALYRVVLPDGFIAVVTATARPGVERPTPDQDQLTKGGTP